MLVDVDLRPCRSASSDSTKTSNDALVALGVDKWRLSASHDTAAAGHGKNTGPCITTYASGLPRCSRVGRGPGRTSSPTSTSCRLSSPRTSTPRHQVSESLRASPSYAYTGIELCWGAGARPVCSLTPAFPSVMFGGLDVERWLDRSGAEVAEAVVMGLLRSFHSEGQSSTQPAAQPEGQSSTGI